jgi:hypothetical protein
LSEEPQSGEPQRARRSQILVEKIVDTMNEAHVGIYIETGKMLRRKSRN